MNRHKDGVKIGTLIKACWQHFQSQKTDDDPIMQATNWVVQIADPAIHQVKHHQQSLSLTFDGSLHFKFTGMIDE